MYLLFDIGGSKTRLSLTTDLENISEPLIFSTPVRPQDIAPEIQRFLEGESVTEIKGAYGGITGIWNRARTELVYSQNMSGWVGEPVVEIIGRTIDAPVRAENDAAVVGLGEVHYGAGQGSDICVYLTVSTGVGGVRLIDQKIDRSLIGFEPGHQIVDRSSIEGEDVYEATLEGRISGTALEQRLGLPPYEIEDPQIWEELAEETAIGVYNAVLHWSPDTVVLGGSMIVGDPAIAVDRIEHYFRSLGSFLPQFPEIKIAELHSIGGIYGALALARQDLVE